MVPSCKTSTWFYRTASHPTPIAEDTVKFFFPVHTFSVFLEINSTKNFSRLVVIISCYAQVLVPESEKWTKARMDLTPVRQPSHLTCSHEENGPADHVTRASGATLKVGGWKHFFSVSLYSFQKSGRGGSPFAGPGNPLRWGTPFFMWKEPRIKESLYDKAGYPTVMGDPICLGSPTSMWTGPNKV